MGTLLDAGSLEVRLPGADSGSVPDNEQLVSILAGVQESIAGYLGYDPTLTVHVNEEGLVEYVASGMYAGRYFAQLKGAPLIPGDGPTVFTSLQLTYALAQTLPSQVNLPYATLGHKWGQVFTLAPGAVEALTWALGMNMPGIRATGYIATYVAGYATGINDPVPSGGGTGLVLTPVLTDGAVTSVVVNSPGMGFRNAPLLVVTPGGFGGPGGGGGGQDTGSGAVLQALLDGAGGVASVQVVQGGRGYTLLPSIAPSTVARFGAAPLPESIRRAAVLLAREALAFEMPIAQMSATANPLAGGALAGTRTIDEEVRYAPAAAGKSDCTLGYGTALAKMAEKLLKQWQLKSTNVVMVI